MWDLKFKLWLEASKCELIQDPINPIVYRLIGNTFPFNNVLKSLGFEYNYKTKQWHTYGLTQIQKEAIHKLGVILPPQLLDAEPALVKLIQTDTGWFLNGHTYPMKNIFKSLGFKWNSDLRKWWKPKLNKKTLEELDKLGIKTIERSLL